jgi:hypothetical protein
MLKNFILLAIVLAFMGMNTIRSQLVVGETSCIADVNVKVDVTSKSEVMLTLTGPSDKWFGVGFGGDRMANTYAIIVDADGAHERKLGNHARGNELGNKLMVKSDSVLNGERTVVLGRARKPKNKDKFVFPKEAGSFNIICAFGQNGVTQFSQASYHGNRMDSSLTLAKSDDGEAGTCDAPGVCKSSRRCKRRRNTFDKSLCDGKQGCCTPKAGGGGKKKKKKKKMGL